MIKEEVERIIDTKIPTDGWEHVFDRLQVIGTLDMKTITKIVIALCKAVEGLGGDIREDSGVAGITIEEVENLIDKKLETPKVDEKPKQRAKKKSRL